MNKKAFTSRVFVIVMLSILFFSFTKNIHDPLYSNTILIEQGDGSWVLQIQSALTAFEYEVHTNYGKDSYKTPDEFNTLVLQHLIKNLSIKINSKHAVRLENGYVKLGHETSAVFEVVGIPKKVTKILFTNSSFKDVFNNQNSLIILKKGFEKQHFILNNTNEHTVELKESRNQFVQQ
jgi:hypothetical protein